MTIGKYPKILGSKYVTNHKMRVLQHEIDTQARKKILLSFPKNWEHRELTGRDYGIDLLVEVFNKTLPTGQMILIQLKGTEKNFQDQLYFDIPVNTLKYSYFFQHPVFLMVCPINDINNQVYYLWLQEYIDVVLDFEKPKWRDNKKTVRLFFPKENIVQNRIDHLEFVAEHPKRLKEFCKLARICSELEYLLDEFDSLDFLCPIDTEEEIKQIISKSEKILDKIKLEIDEIYTLNSLRKLFPEIEDQVLTQTNDLILKLKVEVDIEKRYNLKEYFWNGNIVKPLLSILKNYNDVRRSRVLWEYDRTHNF